MEADRPAPVPQEILEELAQHGEHRVFARNTQLCSEGEPSDFLYILLSGEVKVFTQDQKGRELVYNVLSDGEFFGEFVLDGHPRSASVRALTEVRCIAIDQSLARAFIRANPNFAEFLVLKLIERLRRATELYKHLGLNDVFSRTVVLLDQNAVDEDGIRSIPGFLTQQEIADRVGATREMINHVIADLIKRGFLTRDERRRLVIAKPLPCAW